MIERIYIEKSVRDQERVTGLCRRHPRAEIIECDRYTEVFNLRSQDFRLQKKAPALILARKFKTFVMPVPDGYGIGHSQNFYFSHFLNCLYDCRYCFLQGLYRSANYVLFVNDEEFQTAIREEAARHPTHSTCFFSGYDCDSFALESISGFVESYLPFFASLPEAAFELRTKSLKARLLLDHEPLRNVVVAFSLTPGPVSQALEHRVPPLEKRLELMGKLANHGWPIGLRFDPLIHHQGFEKTYRNLFDDVFARVCPEAVHSASFGSLRFPRGMFDRIARLYPEERLFAAGLKDSEGMVAYPDEVEATMAEFCTRELRKHLTERQVFHCPPH
ncbi:MAG: spore photoproduct lyase family protein [Verrucomicrobiota bacterium]